MDEKNHLLLFLLLLSLRFELTMVKKFYSLKIKGSYLKRKWRYQKKRKT